MSDPVLDALNGWANSQRIAAQLAFPRADFQQITRVEAEQDSRIQAGPVHMPTPNFQEAV